MGAMNELIDADAVARLHAHLARASPGSQLRQLSRVEQRLRGLDAEQSEALSLRARTDLVSAALLDDLPRGYDASAAVIRAALADPSFGGWVVWPVGETVTSRVLAASADAHGGGADREGAGDRDHGGDRFDDGLALLAELTPRLTSEFAIRRLLQHDLKRALPRILAWTASDDEHVRRLASEGTRSFLPWAIRVPALLAAPDATVPILDALYRDESDYVRRSVANHLNDLSRQNADLVVEVAARWQAAPDENTAWVVRHALRTLVKKAHPGALGLLGFAPVTVSVTPPVLSSSAITLPGDLSFGFTLTNEGSSTERMAVDYVVHFVKGNGRQAEKVFKLTSLTLDAGASVTIAKRHAMRQMTTRVHYAGTHALEVQVNGRRFGRTDFDVVL